MTKKCNLTNNKLHQISCTHFNIYYSHEIVPKFNRFVFIMKDIMKGDAIVYSDGQQMNGVKWRLKVYPRGTSAGKNTHVSVFLEMTEAYVNQNKYEYRIELINHLNAK